MIPSCTIDYPQCPAPRARARRSRRSIDGVRSRFRPAPAGLARDADRASGSGCPHVDHAPAWVSRRLPSPPAFFFSPSRASSRSARRRRRGACTRAFSRARPALPCWRRARCFSRTHASSTACSSSPPSRRVFMRRWGQRWTAVGMFAFMASFGGAYFRPSPTDLPASSWRSSSPAPARAHLVREVLVPDRPLGDLRRALAGVDHRVGRVAALVGEAARLGWTARRERRVRAAHRGVRDALGVVETLLPDEPQRGTPCPAPRRWRSNSSISISRWRACWGQALEPAGNSDDARQHLSVSLRRLRPSPPAPQGGRRPHRSDLTSALARIARGLAPRDGPRRSGRTSRPPCDPSDARLRAGDGGRHVALRRSLVLGGADGVSRLHQRPVARGDTALRGLNRAGGPRSGSRPAWCWRR